jgi:hypothetical protein
MFQPRASSILLALRLRIPLYVWHLALDEDLAIAEQNNDLAAPFEPR